MSVQTYQQAQLATEDPRQTEYRLLAHVTRALIQADQAEFPALVRAINWNRRVWLAMQADCASDANRLPEQVRAGIISLAIWVDRHSRLVLRHEADLVPLVEVNRVIMDGLGTAG